MKIPEIICIDIMISYWFGKNNIPIPISSNTRHRVFKVFCLAGDIRIKTLCNFNFLTKVFSNPILYKRILNTFNCIIIRVPDRRVQIPTHHSSNSRFVSFVYLIIIMNSIGLFNEKNSF